MFEQITQRLERLTDGERGVSPVVGFVLIFALIMLVFTIYQADVVPAQNAEVEYKHSQEVEEQLSRMNDAIHQTGTSGSSRSVTISTAVQYPDRALAINPGSPAGSLRTSSPFTVAINDLETQDGHWDGISGPQSRQLIYDANYNEYQSEPRIVVENGLLFREFDGNYVVDSADIISGTKIDLQLINASSSGEYQKSGGSASVSLEPQSTSTEYLNVTPSGTNPTIQLDTTLSQQAWKEILESKDHASLNSYDAASSPATVTIGLDGGQNYDLRITEVGFRSVEKSPKYITREDRRNRSVGDGETTTLVVSARDEFGNPVSGVDVSLKDSTAPGTVTPSTATTNENGRATFTYEQRGQGSGEVTFEIGPDSREQVTYGINQERTDGISVFSPNEVFEDTGPITQIRVKNATPVVIDGCPFNATRYNDSSDFDVSECNATSVPTLNIDFRVNPDSNNDYRGHVVLQDLDRNGEFGDGEKEISLVRIVEIKSGNNKVLAEGELDAQAVKNVFKDPAGTDLLDANNYHRGQLDIDPPTSNELNSGKIKVSNADLIVSEIRGRAVVELD